MDHPTHSAFINPIPNGTNIEVDTGFSRTLTAPSDNPLRSSQKCLSHIPDTSDLLPRHSFHKLESLMAKEIKAFWDVNALTEYLTLEQIPRGLRIKKFPTFEINEEETKLEWTNTLSACSFKLMRIIISVKQKELDRVQNEVTTVQKELADHQSKPGYAELDDQLNKKLDKLERSVISTKKDKRIRDQLDYDTNNVYTWKKPSFRSNRPRRASSKKRVSFSDAEGDQTQDTLAATGTDSSSDNNSATDHTHTNTIPLNQVG